MPVIPRSVRHRRSRKKNPPANRPQPTNPIYITAGVVAGSMLTLTLDQAVTLHGTPKITSPDIPGATAVSATQIALNVVAITFDSAMTGAAVLDIPFRDPAIRSAAGGYLTATRATI